MGKISTSAGNQLTAAGNTHSSRWKRGHEVVNQANFDVDHRSSSRRVSIGVQEELELNCWLFLQCRRDAAQKEVH